MRDDIAAKQVGYPSAGAELADVVLDERLHQVANPVYDQAASGLLLLLSRITTIEPSRKDLLRLGPGHRQSDPTIGADGIFAQSRAGAAKPVHHEKYLAASRRHLHAEAGKACVPVNRVIR